jgi:hypothetical protein
MNNRARQIYKPEFRFGLGGVSLGNEFNKHTDKDAEATLEAAWAVGVRYFDVAPWYGFGLSERRFGHFLHNQKREDYLLSSKVGKLFKASKHNKHAEIYPLSDSPNDIVFDYTANGVRRSIEDSLQRLGVDSLDVASFTTSPLTLRSFRGAGRSSTKSHAKARFRLSLRCATKASSGLGASASIRRCRSSRSWRMPIRTSVSVLASIIDRSRQRSERTVSGRAQEERFARHRLLA